MSKKLIVFIYSVVLIYAGVATADISGVSASE